jgi:uroporphyrinogen decarboxylase
MTSQERFKLMFEHRAADRVPVLDTAAPAAVARWRREGLGENVDWVDFFGLDRVAQVCVDNSPRYPEETLEETADYVVRATCWGSTVKQWKRGDRPPEMLSFTVRDPGTWRKARQRMKPSRDRIDWDCLRQDYARWRSEGRWIVAGLHFGFSATQAGMVGTEPFMMALVEQPEWCADMFGHFLDIDLALLEKVWEAGYYFDAVAWADDLGYRTAQFMPVGMYRELLKPFQQRACQWARSKGVRTLLHSCGDVRPFIPDFLEIGIDGLQPLQVSAGMDPIALKAEYGDRLVLAGGIDAALWADPPAMEARMRQVIPAVKACGGYIFSSDDAVPPTVSLEDFRRIADLAKALGAY